MKTVTKKIEDKDLALLHAEFVVPLVAKDLIEDIEPLDDVAEYTLHDIIGDMAPDGALLCMALTAQRIAACFPTIPACTALKIEADKLVDDYAPLWLAHKDGNAAVTDDMIADQLAYLPEDLEALADLFDLVQPLVLSQSYPATILCDILARQAEMHSAAADNRLEEICIARLPRTSAQTTSNIVIFPR